MTERERFEAWIQSRPDGRSTELHWNGEYFEIAVQLAWEAWQAALQPFESPVTERLRESGG